MHVILLSHEYPPLSRGGVGTFVKNLAYGLQRYGIRVTVVSGYPVPNNSGHQVVDQEENGVNVLRFPYPNFPPRHTMFQLLNLKRLYNVIKKIGADVIHGQSGITFPSLLNKKFFASPRENYYYALLRFSHYYTPKHNLTFPGHKLRVSLAESWNLHAFFCLSVPPSPCSPLKSPP